MPVSYGLNAALGFTLQDGFQIHTQISEKAEVWNAFCIDFPCFWE